ncbi:uncharacterized protein ARMOST_03180 [Armillaria ostoyae]|uniref:Uncharacterized protein n=1 Tax=Armillaria ostoyae TaxID=47428 RepID=A0A284QTU6_ARMOS|nr:uncharacterized protein ARMOST_03180 [Armillaria ostoyae]
MSLQSNETMQELGISSFTYFQLHLCILRRILLSSDQCALNKDAPLNTGPSNAPTDMYSLSDYISITDIWIIVEALSRHSHHQKRTSKLLASLTAEQQDEDSNIIQNPTQLQKQCSQKAKGKAKAVDDGIGSNDKVDDAYLDSDSDSEDKEKDDKEEDDIPNEELANMLPSKTIPLGVRPTDHQLHKSSKCQPKKKQHVSER